MLFRWHLKISEVNFQEISKKVKIKIDATASTLVNLLDVNNIISNETLFLFSSIVSNGTLWRKHSVFHSFYLFLSFSPLCAGNGNKPLDNRPPFNNEAYSAFKRGNVVKGILCPSLTNSFRARSLERSYLTYSHRQRQKSLLIVNIVDLVLKIVLAVIWTYRQSDEVVCKVYYKYRCASVRKSKRDEARIWLKNENVIHWKLPNPMEFHFVLAAATIVLIKFQWLKSVHFVLCALGICTRPIR